jgi:hypothetical protein
VSGCALASGARHRRRYVRAWPLRMVAFASQVNGEERAEAGTSWWRATRFRTLPSAVRDCWMLLLLLLEVVVEGCFLEGEGEEEEGGEGVWLRRRWLGVCVCVFDVDDFLRWEG